MRSDEWLELMCKPSAVTDELPLETPDGTIEDDRFWVKFRTPNAQELDELRATQTREVIEEEVDFDPDDIENSTTQVVRYSETRQTPLVFKAAKLKLIVDARLPKRTKAGDVGVYEWSSNNADNVQFLRKRNQWLMTPLWMMVLKHVMMVDMQRVVMPEGEESADTSDESTSASTETEESEEI